MNTYNFMIKPLKIVENRHSGCDDEKTMKSLLGIISKSRGGDIVITVSNHRRVTLFQSPDGEKALLYAFWEVLYLTVPRGYS